MPALYTEPTAGYVQVGWGTEMTNLDTDRQPMEGSHRLAMFCEIGIQFLCSLESFIKEDFGRAVNLLVTLAFKATVFKSEAIGALLTSRCATAAR